MTPAYPFAVPEPGHEYKWLCQKHYGNIFITSNYFPTEEDVLKTHRDAFVIGALAATARPTPPRKEYFCVHGRVIYKVCKKVDEYIPGIDFDTFEAAKQAFIKSIENDLQVHRQAMKVCEELLNKVDNLSEDRVETLDW